MHAQELQSGPTLWDPMDCSPPGSSVMGFSRQEYWSGFPCLPPGNLSYPGTKPMSPASQADSWPLSHWGSHMYIFWERERSPVGSVSLTSVDVPWRQEPFCLCGPNTGHNTRCRCPQLMSLNESQSVDQRAWGLSFSFLIGQQSLVVKALPSARYGFRSWFPLPPV